MCWHTLMLKVSQLNLEEPSVDTFSVSLGLHACMLKQYVLLQVKGKGERKIKLEQFQKALELIGEKKKKSVEELVAQMAASKGPVTTATKAEANKFHDDKSLYTGALRVITLQAVSCSTTPKCGSLSPAEWDSLCYLSSRVTC
jgi:predicted DNA-binding ribbon-helix-helix protein